MHFATSRSRVWPVTFIILSNGSTIIYSTAASLDIATIHFKFTAAAINFETPHDAPAQLAYCLRDSVGSRDLESLFENKEKNYGNQKVTSEINDAR